MVRDNATSIVLIAPQNDLATFKRYELLGLGYLASFLESRKHSVAIYDCNYLDPRPEAVAHFCRQRGVEIVGFSVMVGSLKNVMKLARDVRRFLTTVPVVCGGCSATFEYAAILEHAPQVDFVLRGEGELSFERLVDEISRTGAEITRFDEVPGLAYRSGGEVRVNPGPVLVTDLDMLPFPRRSRFLDQIGLASILSSRGCPCRCSFCSIQEFYRISSNGAIRCRSAKNVVDEIQEIHKQTGITRFLFVDDNFFGSERFAPGRLRAIAQELIERKLDCVRFEVSSRAIDLKLPALDSLAQAGLDLVYLGLESGSDTQLKRFQKGCRVKHNVWAIQEIRARGIRLDFGFIPFDPYLRPEELLDSLNLLVEHDLISPHTLNTLTVTANLFPGTSLHKRAKMDGLLHQTDDFYYWFEFNERDYAERFNRIIEFFKTNYTINVVDAWTNGERQRGFHGLEADTLKSYLRRVFALWVEHVREILEGEAISDPLQGEISSLETFLQNVLNAHILWNRGSWLEGGDEFLDSETRKIKRAFDRVARGESPDAVDPQLLEPFGPDLRYRRFRRAKGVIVVGQAQLSLRRGEVTSVVPSTRVFPNKVNRWIVDVFIPPSIDVPSRRNRRGSGIPSPTLYLGSVTGTTPLRCDVFSRDGALLLSRSLHKGWSEIVGPTGAEFPHRVTLTTRSNFHKPVTVSVSADCGRAVHAL